MKGKAVDGTGVVRNLALGENGAFRPGEPLVHGTLGVCPLFREADGAFTYLTYEEALSSKTVSVSELGTAGSVPELVIENAGDVAVLILDGEQLVGAKQNRVLNTTVLVSARDKVVIPVTCVEQGRWHYEHVREMRPSREHLYAKTRARKSAQVLSSLLREGRYEADQHDIWRNISDRLDVEDICSPTSAMEDHFAARRGELEGFQEALSFERLKGRGEGFLAGAVFTLSGRVMGMDGLSRSEAMEAQWPKLLNSYAIEASKDAPAGEVSVGEIRSFLGRLNTARMQVFQPPGLGSDVRITDDRLSGSALVHEGEVVHICAFMLDEDGTGEANRYQSTMSGYRDRSRRRG